MSPKAKVLTLLAGVALFGGLWLVLAANYELEVECTSKGGLYIQTKTQTLCVDKSAIISVSK